MYHAFGLRGYRYVRAEYRKGEVVVTVAQAARGLRCGRCGSREVIRKGKRRRRFRGLPIGRRPVWILLEAPRLGCWKCGAVQQAKVSFSVGQRRHTERFARYLLELSRHMTMWDVAPHLGVSWNW